MSDVTDRQLSIAGRRSLCVARAVCIGVSLLPYLMVLSPYDAHQYLGESAYRVALAVPLAHAALLGIWFARGGGSIWFRLLLCLTTLSFFAYASYVLTLFSFQELFTRVFATFILVAFPPGAKRLLRRRQWKTHEMFDLVASTAIVMGVIRICTLGHIAWLDTLEHQKWDVPLILAAGPLAWWWLGIASSRRLPIIRLVITALMVVLVCVLRWVLYKTPGYHELPNLLLLYFGAFVCGSAACAIGRQSESHARTWHRNFL